jgi:hypothetical protein
MADPVPLTDPAGRVFAYACASCLSLGGGFDLVGSGRWTDEEIARRAETSLCNAKACCTCRRCKSPSPVPVDWDWNCPGCAPIAEAEAARRLRDALEAAAKRQAAWSASLGLSLDAGAASCLAARIGDLSEEHYCASWLSECEFSLWSMVTGGNRNWGMGEVEASDIEDLKRLSISCGGWVAWDDEICDRLFVPMSEWLGRYSKWISK